MISKQISENKHTKHMSRLENSLTFQQLLDYCSDSNSQCWQSAWGEFIKRYKKFMYDIVTYRCLKYNIPRVRRQLSDVVNDVFDEVTLLLCKNHCRALQEYRARDNEKKFRAWLTTICNRTTYNYVQDHFFEPLVESDLQEFQNCIHGLDLDIRWQLYEDHVNLLRKFSKRHKRHIERDINIFNMYIWADFSAPMLSSIPCLNNIGHRVVDNVVNRMRANLRQSRNVLD